MASVERYALDFHFYEELNAVVQNEPADFVDPETVGLFASRDERRPVGVAA